MGGYTLVSAENIQHVRERFMEEGGGRYVITKIKMLERGPNVGMKTYGIYYKERRGRVQPLRRDEVVDNKGKVKRKNDGYPNMCPKCGSKIVNEDWAEPDTGGYAAHCTKCDWGFSSTMY